MIYPIKILKIPLSIHDSKYGLKQSNRIRTTLIIIINLTCAGFPQLLEFHIPCTVTLAVPLIRLGIPLFHLHPYPANANPADVIVFRFNPLISPSK